MINIFSNIKKNIQKSSKTIFNSLKTLKEFFVIKKITLDQNDIESIEKSLYEADLGYELTNNIIAKIKKERLTNKNTDVYKLISTFLQDILQKAEVENVEKTLINNDLEVFCLVGINGVGKTTTAAKLGWLLKKMQYKVLLAACDTFRSAATSQLKIWAQKLSLDIIYKDNTKDLAAIAFEAYQVAKKNQYNCLIIDTGGRLHTQSYLLKELFKIKSVLKKQDPKLPHKNWVVLDGNIGNNSIKQTLSFHKEFGINGIIITKLDGVSKGGSLIRIFNEIKIPIYFLGIGEHEDDLIPFSCNNYIENLFSKNSKLI